MPESAERETTAQSGNVGDDCPKVSQARATHLLGVSCAVLTSAFTSTASGVCGQPTSRGARTASARRAWPSKIGDAMIAMPRVEAVAEPLRRIRDVGQHLLGLRLGRLARQLADVELVGVVGVEDPSPVQGHVQVRGRTARSRAHRAGCLGGPPRRRGRGYPQAQNGVARFAVDSARMCRWRDAEDLAPPESRRPSCHSGSCRGETRRWRSVPEPAPQATWHVPVAVVRFIRSWVAQPVAEVTDGRSGRQRKDLRPPGCTARMSVPLLSGLLSSPEPPLPRYASAISTLRFRCSSDE